MDASQVDKLFKAYRQGLLKQLPAAEYRSPSFDFLLKQVVCLKLPVHRRVIVCKIWRSGYDGLRLARAGRLEEASEFFDRCWEDLAQARDSRRAHLLAKAPLEAAHAYLEYKRGQPALARSRIFSAMDADLELESDDDDFILLEMHRLQLAQNLMRIDLRSGEPQRALRLAGQILAYTEGFIDTLPVHHSWRGAEFITRTPPVIRRILVPQIAGDVVLALSSDSQDELETTFLQNARIGDYRTRPGVLNEQFRRWILVKQAFHQKDWDDYLRRLLEFLPTGRRGLQTVWYSSLVDLLKFCRTLNDPASLRLQERLLLETRKWPGLPVPFRPLLGAADLRVPSHVVPQAVSFQAPATI